jgi:hypothetical protein
MRRTHQRIQKRCLTSHDRVSGTHRVRVRMDSTVCLAVVGAGMNAIGMEPLFARSLRVLPAASNTTSIQVSLSIEQPVWTGPRCACRPCRAATSSRSTNLRNGSMTTCGTGGTPLPQPDKRPLPVDRTSNVALQTADGRCPPQAAITVQPVRVVLLSPASAACSRSIRGVDGMPDGTTQNGTRRKCSD